MSSAIVSRSPSPPSTSPRHTHTHPHSHTQQQHCLRSQHPQSSTIGRIPSARESWNSVLADRGGSGTEARMADEDDRGEGSSSLMRSSSSSSTRQAVIQVEPTTSTPLSRFMADYHSSPSSSSSSSSAPPPAAGPSRLPSPPPRPLLPHLSSSTVTAPYPLLSRPHPVPYRVRRHLTCSTCRLTLREPVTLPCGHAVCLSCLPPAEPNPDPDPGPAPAPAASVSATATSSSSRASAPASAHASASRPPTARSNRPPYLCTRPKCAHRLRSMAGYGGVFTPSMAKTTAAKGSELKVDVVLQKVIGLLKGGVPDLFSVPGAGVAHNVAALSLGGAGEGGRGLEGMSSVEREAALMREDEGVDWTGLSTTTKVDSSPSHSSTSTSSSPAYDSFAPRRDRRHTHTHTQTPSSSSISHAHQLEIRPSSTGMAVAGSAPLTSLPMGAAAPTGDVDDVDEEVDEEEDDDDRSPSSTESTPWRAMGDEDEGAGGEGKRGHKTSAWRSTKRMRRASSMGDDDEDQEEQEGGSQVDVDVEQVVAAAADDSLDEAIEAKLHGHGHARTHSHSSKAARRRAPSSSSSDLNHILIPATLGSDLLSELECQVCIGLFHQPVTTPCGHTFCRPCLARALDHSDKCPLCRADYPGFRFFQDQPSNASIASIILSIFPSQYASRLEAIRREEARSDALDTPIFVCSLAFPNMPTFLHVFEPRYRLMIRRAMEKDGRFGMCLPSRNPGQGGVYEYGTMLQIRSVQILQDGRSMVETMGLWRFKVLEKGGLDGYAVGRVERIEDIAPELEEELERAALARNSQRTPSVPAPGPGPAAAAAAATPSTNSVGVPMDADGRPREPATVSLSATDAAASHAQALAAGAPTSSIPNPNAPSPPPPSAQSATAQAAAAAAGIQLTPGPELTTVELMQVCREFIGTLRSGSAPWLVQRLNNTFGPMPENPSDFSFWMAAVIPIDEYEKARLLRITSPRLRLILLAHWASGLQGSWWFRSGCIAS